MSEDTRYHTNYQFGKCSYTFLFSNNSFIIVAVLISLNEFLIDPIFHRCLPGIKHHWKISFGIVLQVGRYAVLVILVTLSWQHYKDRQALQQFDSMYISRQLCQPRSFSIWLQIFCSTRVYSCHLVHDDYGWSYWVSLFPSASLDERSNRRGISYFSCVKFLS